MLDHIGIEIRDMQASRPFYLAVLRSLGYEIVREIDGWIGFGANGKPDFWIREGGHVIPPVHIAFRAPDRETVDRFYATAMAEGGRDNGKPGIRTRYHSSYYGAFVLDPDGHNLEAVCHAPS